jgi:hypothetical protein
MDEFDLPQLTVKEEKYRQKVQSHIKYCSYCQPYDDGDIVWIYGERTELNELLNECNIPEKHWDKILPHLYCPFSGNEGFDLSIDVGVETRYEKQVHRHVRVAEKLHGKLVTEFEKELVKYPLLAMNNRLAKRIYNELKQKKFPITEINGDFFRARKVITPYLLLENEMNRPPKGKPLEGRFNHAGQSHLYLSNNKETAIKESVAEKASVLVWLQKFKIEGLLQNILDLSLSWDKLTPTTSTLLISMYHSLKKKDRNKENWKPDYFITRFIMDCAKKFGYDGIKYDSMKDSFSYNIVLFYPTSAIVTAVGKPTVEVFSKGEEFDDAVLDF